mmetsp:Transcript_7359/g.13044  ORF Transcript_7359/g.13044 Transcript_7359/m.13044 type:complete len:476 (-) Transcript_7359:57-1484(-)
MEVAYYGMEAGLSGTGPYSGSDIHDSQTTQDVEKCAVCELSLSRWGRRKCNICTRHVCHACSQSTILVDGQAAVDRACNGCAALAYRGPVVRNRLDQLAGQLHDIAGVKAVHVQARGCPAPELDEVLGLCEAAEGPLRDLSKRLAAAEARANRAEAAATLNAQSLRRAEEKMHASAMDLMELVRQMEVTLGGGGERGAGSQQGANLDDAAAALRSLLDSERLKAASAFLSATRRPDEAAPRSEAASDEWCKVQQTEVPRELASSADSAEDPCTTFDLEELECGQEEELGAEAGTWQENADSCAECGISLRTGPLTLMNAARHHCRVCGRNVCAGCSPSLIQLSAYSSPQRVCTPCAHNAESGPALTRRLVQLGVVLHRIGGLSARVSSHTVNLEGAVEFCEAAAAMVRNMQPKEKQMAGDGGTRSRTSAASYGHGEHSDASSMDWLAASPEAATTMEEEHIGSATASCNLPFESA